MCWNLHLWLSLFSFINFCLMNFEFLLFHMCIFSIVSVLTLLLCMVSFYLCEHSFTLACCIFSSPFAFAVSASLYLSVSCQQDIAGSYFFMYADNIIYLLIRVFSPFSFSMITNMVVFNSTILFSVYFIWSLFHCFPFSASIFFFFYWFF